MEVEYCSKSIVFSVLFRFLCKKVLEVGNFSVSLWGENEKS